jgi:hypothetical protein
MRGSVLCDARVYLEYLVAVHEMYDQIVDVHRSHRDGSIADEEAIHSLREVPARVAQSALEDVRLVGGDEVVSVAAQLWAHMRREPSPAEPRPHLVRI